FMVDYLKTSYSFSTEVELTPKYISFNKVTLNDIKGNKSTVSGKIFHDNLTNWYFDIDINAKNAQVLNTTLADNDLYYGVAYASGTLSIKGYLDYITMNIGLKSEKGTRIYIPLNNPEEVSKSNFITFVSSDSIAKTEKDNGPDFSGIELNMDFEMTTDAYMYLVFDSKIGDVIEGNGKGNITMTISPAEDLKMFGNYEIESGKYLFTMQNVINKPFQIERGGFIRWNGDPYDANINISAIYKTKAGLYDLFQDSTFKKSVPVNLQLRLTDKLFNPNIAFDIKVQNVDPTVETQISKLINTEEEKYRQAMALIIARRFTTPSALSDRGTVSSGGVVGSNAYELLSNQLSNWASQISNQFNVNVSYNPGDEITTEQFEVGVQTSILNDRVVIDVSGGTSSAIKGQNTSNLVGDFNVEVKANKDGRIRLKAFNRSNNNSLINNINSPYTQGVGIFYRQEFNSFKELAHKFKESLKRKRKVSAPATGN
ncbi:MAG TPA: translocation/assembly module TamB domain-containing protein, partial [Bacteroidia bacterium]|nr:translocation/assembly module TamB domain-containing protein [Bacteroidia bacterium]